MESILNALFIRPLHGVHQTVLWIATTMMIRTVLDQLRSLFMGEPVAQKENQLHHRKAKETVVVKDTKWIKHYSNKHKILLVGEGDFSFAVSLAKAFGSATNMVATSRDSKRMLLNSYSAARQNLKQLKKLGCSVFHGVCVYTMSEHTSLCLKQFDRIVFNFPHAGFHYREHQIEQIHAMKMLTSGGQVHITHKTSHPFCKWEVKDLAMDVGLRLVKEVPFLLHEYPGYQNKKGDGIFKDKSFPVGACSTYKFRR